MLELLKSRPVSLAKLDTTVRAAETLSTLEFLVQQAPIVLKELPFILLARLVVILMIFQLPLMLHVW
jgi:hypothetical protein